MATTSKTPSASSLQDQMEKDLLTCPICCGRYNNPRVLKCQHAFCYQCLHGCFKVAEKSSKKTIKCPVCRKSTNIPQKGVDDIPTSFVIAGLLNMVQDSEKKTKKQEKVMKSSADSKHDKQPAARKNAKSNSKSVKAKSAATGKHTNAFKNTGRFENNKKCEKLPPRSNTTTAPLSRTDSNQSKIYSNCSKMSNIALQKNCNKTAENKKVSATKKEVKSKQVGKMAGKFGSDNKTSRVPISKAKKLSTSASVKVGRHRNSTQCEGSGHQTEPTTSNDNQSKTKKMDISAEKIVSKKKKFALPKADENANVKTLKNIKDYENESEESELDSVYEDEYTLSSQSGSYDDESETSYTDSSDERDRYDSSSGSYDDEGSSSDSYSDISSFSTSTDDESSDPDSPTIPKLRSCSGIKLNMKVCIFNKRGRKFNGVVRVLEKFVRRPPKQTCVYAGVQLEQKNACLSTKDLKDMDDSYLNAWLVDASYPCAVVRVDQCISSKLLKEYL